jgi:multidrug efflux system membrane fusion protein
MPEEPSTSSRPENRNAPRRRSLAARILVWLIVLAAFGGLFSLVFSLQTGPSPSAQKGGLRGLMAGQVAVTAAIARKGDIGVYQEALGTVTPVYTSSITSQVTGTVIAVRYHEGQTVQKGDPLVDLDSRPYEANLAQARGTLAKDTQALAQARMDLARYQEAWNRNAIAKQVLEDQEKVVLQDEGLVKADEGAVQFDQVQVAYCHIVSPIDGRVGLRLIDPGNLVQANSTTPLVVVTQEQPITVIFTVAEDALGQIAAEFRRGRRLRVDAYDRTGETRIAIGTLSTIDNQIDTTTGTVKMRALFENRDRALFPNQFVNTRVLVRTLKGVTLIPTSAIQHNGEVSFVYAIRNGAAVQQNVTPGVTDGDVTAVEGIAPGDIVANSSFEKLQPNAKVAIAKPAPVAGQGGDGGRAQ